MNPTWTANPTGNVVPNQLLGAGASTGAWLDFRSVMRGRVVMRTTPYAGISATNGAQIYVYLASIAHVAQDTFPIFTFVLPQAASQTRQVTYELDCGFYYAAVVNADTAYSAYVDLTSETLSWPS